MTKQEFEKKVGYEVTPEAYNLVEYIYAWYPGISARGGKQEVAYLYKAFGTPIFFDMKPRAEENMWAVLEESKHKASFPSDWKDENMTSESLAEQNAEMQDYLGR